MSQAADMFKASSFKTTHNNVWYHLKTFRVLWDGKLVIDDLLGNKRYFLADSLWKSNFWGFLGAQCNGFMTWKHSLSDTHTRDINGIYSKTTNYFISQFYLGVDCLYC